MNEPDFDLGELIDVLEGIVARHSNNQTEAARYLGVSASYLNSVLHHKVNPGPKILSGAGFAKRVSYYRHSDPAKYNSPARLNDTFYTGRKHYGNNENGTALVDLLTQSL